MRREFLVSFFSFFLCLLTLPANATQFNCGPGYVLVESRQKIDGIPTAACEKLWCWDLETGKVMGQGEKANSGYQSTSSHSELCDASGRCVECWGARKWCAGEVRGEWYPEYGAYTRGGDNTTYQSYQKGSCFAWRLEKPDCADGMSAILQNGEWICAVEGNQAKAMRASGLRRTGTIRRLK